MYDKKYNVRVLTELAELALFNLLYINVTLSQAITLHTVQCTCTIPNK